MLHQPALNHAAARPRSSKMSTALRCTLLFSCLVLSNAALARNIIPLETTSQQKSPAANKPQGISTTIAPPSSTHRAAASTSAWQPQPVYHPWYAGLLLGAGESADSNLGFAVGMNSGYAFNSNVAAEFTFLRTPVASKKSNYLFAGNAKISLPLGSLRAFGKAGLGIVKSPDKSRFALLLGGGADYTFPSRLSIGAEMLGTVGANEAQSFSILASTSYAF